MGGSSSTQSHSAPQSVQNHASTGPLIYASGLQQTSGLRESNKPKHPAFSCVTTANAMTMPNQPNQDSVRAPNAKFRVGCDLLYEVCDPSSFILNVSVAQNAFQTVTSESFVLEPNLPFYESHSAVEEKRIHRFSSNAGTVRVLYSAAVELSHHMGQGEEAIENAPGLLPAEVVPYLYPSRFCESDKLSRVAWHEFGHLPPGFPRITAVANWIHQNVEYLRGGSNPRTSAYDTVTERTGVCRDFAHLGVAFTRALGIPARFVAGYALGLAPADFHAYFEAYLGDRWYIFDPTRLAPPTSFVRIGIGRDAADTSFATIFGPVNFVSMTITMEQTEGDPAQFIDYPLATAPPVLGSLSAM